MNIETLGNFLSDSDKSFSPVDIRNKEKIKNKENWRENETAKEQFFMKKDILKRVENEFFFRKKIW